MEQELKLKIGADVNQAVQGLNQVSEGVKKLGDTSKNGAYALNSLSQVARDLPFGFIAIQNNLPIVADQFAILARTSGGLGGAFRSVGAALLGPAGISFAFGAVIAGATALIQKYGSLSNAVNVLFEKTDNASKAKKQLASAMKEGNEEAAKEIAKLSVLVAVANDHKNSIDNRNEAAKKLLSTYGEYLGNVSQEAILNGNAADAINRAKDALLNKALAQASESKLAEIGAKLLDNQLAQVDAAKKLVEQKQLAAEQEKRQFSGNGSDRDLVGQNFLQQQIRLNSARDAFKSLQKDGKDLQAQYENLTNAAAKFARAAGDGFIKDEKGLASTGKTKVAKVTDDLKELSRTIQTVEGGGVEALFKDIENISKLDRVSTVSKVPTTIQAPKSKQVLDQIFAKDKAQQNIKDITELISGPLNSAISSVFEAFQKGGNVLQAIGQSMLDIILQVIQKLIVAASIAAVITALTGGIAGGGVSFLDTFKGLVGFHADGGIATKAQLGVIGENGPEAIIPLSQLGYLMRNVTPQVNGISSGSGVQVSGVLMGRGNDLIAVINQAGRSQNRSFGG